MENETIVQLDKETYNTIQKMLNSTDDDFELGCEILENIEQSDVALLLLIKSLIYGKRQALIKKFNDRLTILFTNSPSSTTNSDNKYAWEYLFPIIKTLNPNELEKELVINELEKLISSTIDGLEFKFLKSIKIELSWT